MGNTHSTEAPQRQSHRLSKPNMGNHTTAGLLSPSFSYSTRRFSNARLSAIPPSPTLASSPTSTLSTTFEVPGDLDDLGVERRASAVSTKQSDSKRRSLFRSKSSQRAPDPERRNSLIGSGLRGPDKLDRANSMTYESALSYYGQAAPENWPTAPRSRASWNYDMGSYAAKRLLNLDEEPALEQATTMSENMMSVVSETTWKSSNPANPTSARISRANSDLSLYMPVRRRSVIQTPGVATRSNSTRNSPAPSRPGTFRHSHPPTPNLSRQQSFESYGNGVMSMPPPMTDREYMPRVVTPCEDDYQSIGAYKLGSLRITNGAASPMSPENEMDRKDERLEKSDYFSRTQAPELGDTTSEVAQDHKQPPEVLTKVEAPQPRSVHLSPIAMSFMSLEVTSDVSEAWSKDSAAVTDVPPDYLAEINFAPFSLSVSPPPSPKLETTSKTSAQEAHLFEDETQPEYSSVEVLDVRLDLSAKSQHDQIASGDTSKILERTDSGFVSISSPVIFEQPHKPLTKADSGYSSNVSLRSFHAKAHIAEADSTMSLERHLSQPNQRNIPAETKDQSLMRHLTVPHLAAPRREPPPPPVPPKDPLPRSPTRIDASAVPKKSLSTQSQPRRYTASDTFRKMTDTLLQVDRPRSGDTGPRYPDSALLTPTSAKSAKSSISDNSNSTLSIGSASHKPNRLQRLLSGARRSTVGPLTVHTTHVSEKTSVPSIPRDVEHKLHERTGLFPLTTKRLALQTRSSKDTLKTIFSVGSMEASLEAVNSIPVVAEAPEAESQETLETKGNAWRYSLNSVPASIVHVAAHVMPRKPIPRKSVPNQQKLNNGSEKEGQTMTALPVEADLTTYSSVSSSLGSNPYDAAFTVSSAPQNDTVSPTAFGRTMSLTASMERSMHMTSAGPKNNVLESHWEIPSPSFPSPPFARAQFHEPKSRTPPPVSMMNKRSMSLRVPPPLRSQSSTASLSRQASRESVRSHASNQLARKASTESIRNHPSYSLEVSSEMGSNITSPTAPAMDPRRMNSFRRSQTPQPPQPKVPIWGVQTDHGLVHRSSETSLNEDSRHNSLSSSKGQEHSVFQRPASAQEWQVRTINQPPLRHRSSYDGYNHQQKRPQKGHPPSMSNGYSAPSKPKFDPRNIGQFDPSAGPWSQDGRYPPPLPRGHHRHRSLSNQNGFGSAPPFRVLHSYNSPAYRNVPIWG